MTEKNKDVGKLTAFDGRYFIVAGAENIYQEETLEDLLRDAKNAESMRLALEYMLTPYTRALHVTTSLRKEHSKPQEKPLKDHNLLRRMLNLIGIRRQRYLHTDWELDNPKLFRTFELDFTSVDGNGQFVDQFKMGLKEPIKALTHFPHLVLGYPNKNFYPDYLEFSWKDYVPQPLMTPDKQSRPFVNFFNEFCNPLTQQGGTELYDSLRRRFSIKLMGKPEIDLGYFWLHYDSTTDTGRYKETSWSKFIYQPKLNNFTREWTEWDFKNCKGSKFSTRETFETREFLDLIKATLSLIPINEIVKTNTATK